VTPWQAGREIPSSQVVEAVTDLGYSHEVCAERSFMDTTYSTSFLAFDLGSPHQQPKILAKGHTAI
jgi:hypothetical protein